MATSVVPALIDALVTAADAALPAVSVVDGMTISNDPGTYLQIGVSDPDADAFTLAADTEETPATMGTNRSRDELGAVFCVVEAWDGAGNAKAARDAAYAVTAAVADIVRAVTVPAFGIAGLLNVGFAVDGQTLTQGQFPQGAVARVLFHVNFHARI